MVLKRFLNLCLIAWMIKMGHLKVEQPTCLVRDLFSCSITVTIRRDQIVWSCVWVLKKMAEGTKSYLSAAQYFPAIFCNAK